jgi:hypothetical protein
VNVARTIAKALAGLLLAAGVWACGPAYEMKAPDDFKRFDKSSDFKLITADGVRLKAREVDNYPKATLSFWSDAMKRHLVKRGYAFKSKLCFKNQAGVPGCTLDFVIPRGAEDWVFSETIFVQGERIVLIEAVGPYARFAPLEKRLRESFKTFSLGD